MSAIYSQQVKDTLYNYEQSLIDKDSIYHVSRRRRLEKIKRLRKYLQSLSSDAHSRPICDSKILGQIFNTNGEPLDLIKMSPELNGECPSSELVLKL